MTLPGLLDKVVAALDYHWLSEVRLVLAGAVNSRTGATPLSEFLRPAAGWAARPHLDPAAHTAIMPFSSGTTGPPKGVQLSSLALTAAVTQVSQSSVFRSAAVASLLCRPTVWRPGARWCPPRPTSRCRTRR